MRELGKDRFRIATLLTVALLTARGALAQSPAPSPARSDDTRPPLSLRVSAPSRVAHGGPDVHRPDPGVAELTQPEEGAPGGRDWMRHPLARTAAALSAVLAIFFAFAYLVRGRESAAARSPNRNASLVMLQRVNVDAKQHLQVVRWGDRLLLLSVTAQGCRTLSEVTDPAEVLALSGHRGSGLANPPQSARPESRSDAPAAREPVFQRQA